MSNVAELRKGANLTQRQLADLVGVTEATIANWETGRSGLEWFVRLDRLCKALRCAPVDLYRIEESQAAEDQGGQG
ncbi:transcriptional regulator [Gloeobacter kilaueensis JS1]|uniref:Transcriptional regulator n=2 Tax=Gloeobacter TaxID=33071 RepID=U5QCJ5_GLOK1|nr:transcriptional regulator [Gloeobacter kilaueensis JS1]